MGKFDGILICTDLDGTLFKNDGSISLENKEAIEYFKREGGYFTFITGRMPYYASEAYRAVNPNVPFGCGNGGGVYDGERNTYVWTCELRPDVCELIECIDEEFADVGFQMCGFDKTYFAKENETMEIFRKRTGVPNVICDYRNMNVSIAKTIFGSEKDEEILAIEKALRLHPMAHKFDFVRSERTLFEILPKGVNKGLAISKLVEYLQIDPKNTIAIGDYNNDVPMFKAAGLGVAVANACREALDAADTVTVSNDEHAIARVIYDLESGKYTL